MDKSGFRAAAYRGEDLFYPIDESSLTSHWHNPSDSTPGEIQWYQVQFPAKFCIDKLLFSH